MSRKSLLLVVIDHDCNERVLQDPAEYDGGVDQPDHQHRCQFDWG